MFNFGGNGPNQAVAFRSNCRDRCFNLSLLDAKIILHRLRERVELLQKTLMHAVDALVKLSGSFQVAVKRVGKELIKLGFQISGHGLLTEGAQTLRIWQVLSTLVYPVLMAQSVDQSRKAAPTSHKTFALKKLQLLLRTEVLSGDRRQFGARGFSFSELPGLTLDLLPREFFRPISATG